ncbi:MAG: hypothetical protein RIE52_03745 [Balneola sp.]|jgi:hypothetical protein
MEQSIKASETRRDTIKWIGLIVMVAGTVSFSNYEMAGNVLTLIGAIIIVGTCLYSRLKR